MFDDATEIGTVPKKCDSGKSELKGEITSKSFVKVSGVVEAGVSGAKDANGKEKVGTPPKKSWSQVVEDVRLKNPVVFKYVPPAEGSLLVTPPDEILRKGNEKFKTTIVGSFTKGVVSYSKVCKFAHTMWGKKGLVLVSQKDSRTFHFKFDSFDAMTKALSRGTWYLDKQPMVMLAWGAGVGSVESIPLWVKFEKVPDCYWTQEGLSSLASAIGPPLGADELTSKLEVLPFAKMCVQYKVGKDLPNKIEAVTMDPITEEKTTVEVLVSYPMKPLVCSGCHTLGHLVGACPKVTRKWVRKEKQVQS